MSDYYLTPEELDIAEMNGIGKALVQDRVYRHGWEKERAITQKRRDTKTSIWKTWSSLSESNGIGKSTFHDRVRKGMSPKDAATAPLFGTKNGVSRTFSKEILELAAANGISRQRLYERVQKSKWNEHRAATTPIIPKEEAHKYRKNNKYKEKHNQIITSIVARKKMLADKEAANERLAKTRA